MGKVKQWGVEQAEADLQLNFEKQKKETKGFRLRSIESGVARLKIRLAEKKNGLSGKKDILLPDKPKPPKKGQIFQQLRKLMSS